jgi:hypothetical protein
MYSSMLPYLRKQGKCGWVRFERCDGPTRVHSFGFSREIRWFGFFREIRSHPIDSSYRFPFTQSESVLYFPSESIGQEPGGGLGSKSPVFDRGRNHGGFQLCGPFSADWVKRPALGHPGHPGPSCGCEELEERNHLNSVRVYADSERETLRGTLRERK